jgi:hypothetical protein
VARDSTSRELHTNNRVRALSRTTFAGPHRPVGEVVASADNSFLEPSTFTDPLADANSCSRDVKFLQDLSVNAIRVYSVDSTLNHDACMQTLSNAGIYTMLDTCSYTGRIPDTFLALTFLSR